MILECRIALNFVGVVLNRKVLLRIFKNVRLIGAVAVVPVINNPFKLIKCCILARDLSGAIRVCLNQSSPTIRLRRTLHI